MLSAERVFIAKYDADRAPPYLEQCSEAKQTVPFTHAERYSTPTRRRAECSFDRAKQRAHDGIPTKVHKSCLDIGGLALWNG
ncbi:hypothetical protein AAHC03_017013 [Spirometra sp. Aus1]